MKKVLVMVVAAMMATVNVNAQDEPLNEIGVAYGGASNTNIIGSFYNGIFTGSQSSYWGPVSLEYFRRLESAPKLGFGAVLAISGSKWDDSNRNAKTTFYTVMPAVKYNWVVKSHLSMYSKVAAGITIASDSGSGKTESATSFNFQLTGFGIEFGSAFRVFAEAGLGEQGMILGGLRYKF